MEGSVGTALRNARLQKKISIEEAARVTKIRPERIKDLECDEYTRFPSLAYARSFLILYSKYLGLDVSKYQTMDVGNPAGVGDYQYLQNEAGVDSLWFKRQAAAPPPKPILFRALLIFLACVAVGALSAYFVLLINRLPSVDDMLKKHQKDDRAVLGTPEASTTPSATPIPVRKAIPVVPPTATGTANAEPQVSSTGESTAIVPAPPAQPAMDGTAVRRAEPVTDGTAAAETARPAVPEEVRRAEPVLGGSSVPAAPPVPVLTGSETIHPEAASPGTETAAPTPVPPLISATVPGITGTAAAQPTPEPAKPAYEVRVRVSRKTWVIVVRDDPESEPVFDGKLSPGTAPLLLKGNQFWVKTKDPKDHSALKVSTDARTTTQIPGGVKVP